VLCTWVRGRPINIITDPERLDASFSGSEEEELDTEGGANLGNFLEGRALLCGKTSTISNHWTQPCFSTVLPLGDLMGSPLGVGEGAPHLGNEASFRGRVLLGEK